MLVPVSLSLILSLFLSHPFFPFPSPPFAPLPGGSRRSPGALDPLPTGLLAQCRCTTCPQCISFRQPGVPVSDSAPLRVLHLYALIATRDDGATPMRMKPVRLVVHAPPDTWKWDASAPASGRASGSLQDVEMAHPTQSGALFLYNKKESDSLWSWSSCYGGEDRDSATFC